MVKACFAEVLNGNDDGVCLDTLRTFGYGRHDEGSGGQD
jgi:hypothetical protein